MKFVILLLAFSILTQAHQLCVPGSCHSASKVATETGHCSADNEGKKSCCHKDKLPTSDSHSDKNDDGKSCNCFCCLKVFIPSPTFYYNEIEILTLPESVVNLWPDHTHGFDYMEELYHPPQLLS